MSTPSLFDPPEPEPTRRRAVARASDPGTSWAAARSVGDLRDSQKAVLSLLRQGPATDEALAARAAAADVQLSPSGLRSRRAELVAAGYAEDSGDRQRTASGRATIVWRVRGA